MDIATLIGLGGGGRLPTYALLVAASRSITVPADGWATVTAMGGGSGGGRSYAPGNSAGWGIKSFPVRAGDVIAISIAAGGAAVKVSNNPTIKGGDTSVSLNGTVIAVAPGGGAGPSSSGVKSPVADSPTGMDFWTPGRQPQGELGLGYVGGAAVDLGGGTYSSGVDYGDSSVGSLISGVPTGAVVPAFGLCLNSAAFGAPGAGSGPSAPSPLFGGGAGNADSSGALAPPGRGGSAGTSTTTSNTAAGGAGLAYIRLYADAT